MPRPGVPAVALTLAGTLHLPLTAVVAALEVSLGVALGLASYALARDAGVDRLVAVAAGVLGGTYAVHLAAGYLATLAFAVAFVVGLVALATDDGRSPAVAAVAFVAATLSHPLVAPLAVVILAVLAALSWRDDRRGVGRIGAAVGAAGVATALGLAALSIGPDPLAVETSRDGFLRRVGLAGILRDAYLDRFLERWPRYVHWISLPLLAVALSERRTDVERTGDRARFARRALIAWVAVTAVGVAVSVVGRWIPPDRFVTFGFAIPVLAAFGLGTIARRLRGRPQVVALGTPAILLVVMLAGAWVAWQRQEPFLEDREVRQVAVANAVARRGSPDASLVFLVNERDETISFLAARAANVIRATVDPERIRDVLILVPRGADTSSVERRAIEETTHDDLRRAVDTGEVSRFGLTTFDSVDFRGHEGSWDAVAPGVYAIAVADSELPPDDATGPGLEGTSPAGIALTSVLTLLLFGTGGVGWARAAGFERDRASATAPALGFVAFVVVAIALERIGVPLTGDVGPTAVSVVTVAGGFVLRALLQRRARA